MFWFIFPKLSNRYYFIHPVKKSPHARLDIKYLTGKLKILMLFHRGYMLPVKAF
jgi:hypothetical protein